MNQYDYECPKCGSHDLSVAITTQAKLVQDGGLSFHTEEEGDHEWDDESTMWCNECKHSENAGRFSTTPERCPLCGAEDSGTSCGAQPCGLIDSLISR